MIEGMHESIFRSCAGLGVDSRKQADTV
jgi:hypothetical protein